jgi:hypothetical protein
VVALDLDHTVSDAPARTATLLELFGEIVERRRCEWQPGDHRDAFAAASLSFPTDAHHRLFAVTAAFERGDEPPRQSLAFCIDVHGVKSRRTVGGLKCRHAYSNPSIDTFRVPTVQDVELLGFEPLGFDPVVGRGASDDCGAGSSQHA